MSDHRTTESPPFNSQNFAMLPFFPVTGTLEWSGIPEYFKCEKDCRAEPCHACCFIVLVDAELHSLFASPHFLRMRRPRVEHSLVWIGHINGLRTLLTDGGRCQAYYPPRQHIIPVHTGNAKCTDCYWQLYCRCYIHSAIFDFKFSFFKLQILFPLQLFDSSSFKYDRTILAKNFFDHFSPIYERFRFLRVMNTVLTCFFFLLRFLILLHIFIMASLFF